MCSRRHCFEYIELSLGRVGPDWQQRRQCRLAVVVNVNVDRDSVKLIHLPHTANTITTQGSHSFADKRKSRTYPGPHKNFPGPFWSPRKFKYKEKLHLPTIFRVQSIAENSA